MVLGAAGLAVGLALSGCSSQADDSGTSGSDSVAVESPAPGEVSLLSAEQFDAASSQEGVVLLDVRTPEEFAEGHIEGATNIDFYSPTFGNDILALDAGQEYAVYCRSGNRSATTTAFMSENGFDSIYELQGGIVAWESAGLPVS